MARVFSVLRYVFFYYIFLIVEGSWQNMQSFLIWYLILMKIFDKSQHYLFCQLPRQMYSLVTDVL